MLNGKSILITGGSGFFGRNFIEYVLRDYPGVKRIVIYSRDVQKQDEIKLNYPEKQYPQLRFFLGDVRDFERLKRAFEGINIIIHAASIASLEASEYNPEECIKTNIIGTENVINAALASNVSDVIALSSDKACAPVSLYGATQLVSDKLITAANNMKGSKNIKFSVIRYGNVIGGRGSVMQVFLHKKALGGNKLPITDKRMTRFLISIHEVISAVIYALKNHIGGEIFIPKTKSYKISDLATAVAPDMEQYETGIRPCEKIHENLISLSEAISTIDLGDYYAIIPAITYTGQRCYNDFLSHYNANPVNPDFSYSSENNSEWESVESLRSKIRVCLKSYKI